MKRLGMLSVLLLVASAAAAQEAPRERPPIIDMHLHAMPADSQGPPGTPACPGKQPMVFLPRDPVTSPSALSLDQTESCAAPLLSARDDQDLMRRTLAALERYNIRAVTSGPPALVQQWRAQAPDRILPGLPLWRPNPATLDSVRTLFRSGEFAVLGEVATQYNGFSPSDPEMEPYFALAEELDVPVGIHMGLGPPGTPYHPGLGNYRARLSNPLLLEEVLLRHPKLRLYVMHAGWPMLDEMVHLLYTYPQVYVDVGVIDWAIPRKEFHRYLRRLVEAGFGKRIMFGSDQMVWPEAVGLAIEGIESAEFLTEEQKRDIFYHNAARFLRLDQQAASK